MQTAQQWVLPKDATSPALARRHLRTIASGPDDVLEVALLLASELVTNAVKYGGDHIVLSVVDEAERLRVEVQDDGLSIPRVGVGGSHAVGGRGLLLVQSLADDWGMEGGDGTQPGTSVWFALRKPS